MSLKEETDKLPIRQYNEPLTRDHCHWGLPAKFDKTLTEDQWKEIKNWCNHQFGEKNWFVGPNYIMFNGHCPESSSTLFLLRWS